MPLLWLGGVWQMFLAFYRGAQTVAARRQAACDMPHAIDRE